MGLDGLSEAEESEVMEEEGGLAEEEELEERVSPERTKHGP